MTLRSQALPIAVILVTCTCHSANWSPPEPQQAPAPTMAPAAATAETAAEPPSQPSSSAAAPGPSAAASSAPAALASSDAPLVPSATAAAKEAHKAPEGAASTGGAYTGPDPCQAKTFHYSAIGGACRAGGRKAVKEIMRGVLKKAKAAGQDVKCTSCHEDTSSYLLKPNAVSDIKQWF